MLPTFDLFKRDRYGGLLYRRIDSAITAVRQARTRRTSSARPGGGAKALEFF
jgi:hypothetical protein